MGINHASGGGSREFQAFKRRNKPMYSQSTLSGSSQGQKDSKPKNKVSEIFKTDVSNNNVVYMTS